MKMAACSTFKLISYLIALSNLPETLKLVISECNGRYVTCTKSNLKIHPLIADMGQ